MDCFTSLLAGIPPPSSTSSRSNQLPSNFPSQMLSKIKGAGAKYKKAHPKKFTRQWNIHHLMNMYFLLKMGDFPMIMLVFRGVTSLSDTKPKPSKPKKGHPGGPAATTPKTPGRPKLPTEKNVKTTRWTCRRVLFLGGLLELCQSQLFAQETCPSFVGSSGGRVVVATPLQGTVDTSKGMFLKPCKSWG